MTNKQRMKPGDHFVSLLLKFCKNRLFRQLAGRSLHYLDRLVMKADGSPSPLDPHPVFIIGSPRSGTTIFYQHVRIHPQLSYFTQASDLLPHAPVIINRLLDSLRDVDIDRIAQELNSERILQWTDHGFRYAEGSRIWNVFSGERKSSYWESPTPREKTFYRYLVRAHNYLFRTSRFVNKAPIHSLRIKYLLEIYDQPYFIHVLRDGRAVAHSIRAKYNEMNRLNWGPQPASMSDPDVLENHLIRAGKQWKKIVNTIQEDLKHYDDSFHTTIKYEHFTENPSVQLKRILDFCNLPSEQVSYDFSENEIQSKNYKWKQNFSKKEIKRLEQELGNLLSTFNYL